VRREPYRRYGQYSDYRHKSIPFSPMLIELDKSNGKEEQDPDHYGIRDPDGSYLHQYELDTSGIDTVKWPISERPICTSRG
jgi:hypothetical protein